MAVHDSSSDELEDLAAAFALESLAPDERDDYLAHLRVCGVCQRLVGQYQTVAELLPNALEERAASPELKARIMSEAASEPEVGGPAPGRTASDERSTPRWWLRPWLTPALAGAAAVLIAVLAGLVVWNIGLQGQLRDRDDRLEAADPLVKMAEAIRRGGAVQRLLGTEGWPNASGNLVQDPERTQAFLVTRNLPSLPSSSEYHVWRITGDELSDVGSFTSTGAEAQIVALAVDFSGADAIGVSIEDAGSRPAAPGDIVLLGP